MLRLGEHPRAVVTTTPRNVGVLKRLLEAQESRQTSRTTDTLDGKFLRQTSGVFVDASVDVDVDAQPAAVPAEKASNASNVSPLSGPTELPEAAQVPRVVPPARRASSPPARRATSPQRTTSPQLHMWHIPQT